MKNCIGVIVIGGHVQGLNILRIFFKNGIKGIVLDESKYNLARHSKYCTAFIKYPENELLVKLFTLKLKYKGWLLFPTTDKHVEVLSKNKSELEKKYIVCTDYWNVEEKF